MKEMDISKEVNWSEVAREAIRLKVNQLRMLRSISSRSHLSEEDALEIGSQINESLSQRYRDKDGIRKRKIFETYMRDKNISDEDAVFYETIDWHPVDELPLKEEFIDKIKKAAKEPGIPVKDLSELFR